MFQVEGNGVCKGPEDRPVFSQLSQAAGEKKAKKEKGKAGLVGETKRDTPCMGCLQQNFFILKATRMH